MVASLLALALLLPAARAFLAAAPPPRARSAVHSLRALSESDEGCTRRELLRSASVAGAASLLARPSAASATTAVAPSKPSTIVSQTLCDPSVSTWIKRYDGGALRTVHILGTAHISASSAELAGKLVRDLKPNVVFVELDAKRVARAIPGAKGGGVSSGAGASAASSGGISSGAAEASSSLALGNGCGNQVKGMYGKLEAEGFKAGDEFAISVREGLVIGSTIVLGDRDVEVTLRRLTRALTKTDIRKLLSADSEVNASMEELLPEGMKAALKSPSGGGGGSAGGNSMSVSSMGMDGVQIDKGEFQTFVETMKTKDNVKKVMRVLKSSAPEIYEAMVAERDVYMARGLDELGDSLKGSSVDNTVAVMGMAHVDGVETYLASQGWEELKYPCPAVR